MTAFAILPTLRLSVLDAQKLPLIVRGVGQDQDVVMAYGDDLASPIQRRLAFVAVVLALFELAYGWLVAGMMAAAPNPRLTMMSSVLALIIVANCALIFGRARQGGHWLRALSLVSIAAMVLGPAILALLATARDGG